MYMRCSPLKISLTWSMFCSHKTERNSKIEALSITSFVCFLTHTGRLFPLSIAFHLATLRQLLYINSPSNKAFPFFSFSINGYPCFIIVQKYDMIWTCCCAFDGTFSLLSAFHVVVVVLGVQGFCFQHSGFWPGPEPLSSNSLGGGDGCARISLSRTGKTGATTSQTLLLHCHLLLPGKNNELHITPSETINTKTQQANLMYLPVLWIIPHSLFFGMM